MSKDNKKHNEKDKAKALKKINWWKEHYPNEPIPRSFSKHVTQKKISVVQSTKSITLQEIQQSIPDSSILPKSKLKTNKTSNNMGSKLLEKRRTKSVSKSYDNSNISKQNSIDFFARVEEEMSEITEIHTSIHLKIPVSVENTQYLENENVNARKIICIDTETTGFSRHDRVCQIGFVAYDGIYLQQFMDYCNPHAPMNPFAYACHRIPQSKLLKSQDLQKTKTYEMLESYNNHNNIFVFHNAKFDLRMLGYDGFVCKAEVLDTIKIIKSVKRCKKHSLDHLIQNLGIQKNRFKMLKIVSHDALGDAIAVFLLVNWVAENYPDEITKILGHETASQLFLKHLRQSS